MTQVQRLYRYILLMKDLVEEVLELQYKWTSAPSPDMVRRGRATQHEIAGWIGQRLPKLAGLVPGVTEDIAVDASDGAGAKAKVPWARVFSRSRAPSAQEGW